MPSRSHSAASSVAVTRSRARARCALARSSRAESPAASARARAASRSTVRTIAPVVVDLLERVDDRQRGDRAASPRAPRRSTRSIVASPTSGRAASCTSTISRLVGQVLEPVRHALAARRGRRPRRAAGRRRTGRATAADRRRSAAAARTRPCATSGRAMNVCTLCSSIGLPATQRNCLSSVAADARAAAAGDDDDADVAHRRRSVAHVRTVALERGRAIVRNADRRAMLARRTRVRHARARRRYAVVMPMFAASARRRSACDTGRISPPSPTSPTKTASAGARGRTRSTRAPRRRRDRLPAPAVARRRRR